jgi:hypothetical protein
MWTNVTVPCFCKVQNTCYRNCCFGKATWAFARKRHTRWAMDGRVRSLTMVFGVRHVDHLSVSTLPLSRRPLIHFEKLCQVRNPVKNALPLVSNASRW